MASLENTEKPVPFWPVMIGIFFGSFLAILGTSSINVAIPILMQDFNTDLNTVQWTLTGFMLATGVIAPITGYLGDRFSTKYLYVAALIGFTLMSGLCAVAWNIHSLIVFRILQGAFSGMVMPATMTIIYQVIPRERQAFAISMWSLSAMLAPALGPSLAGWLIQTFDWTWLFLINLPFGIIAIALAMKLIPYYRLTTPKPFDLFGFLAVILSSSALLIAFSEAHAWGWGSWQTISLLAFGALTLIVFVLYELRKAGPLLNLRVFAYSRYTYSLILSCIITISLYSGTFLTPVFLQNIQHVSAFDTGLILLIPSLAMAVCMPITGKLYSRVGPMPLILFGIVLIGVGTLAMAHLSVDVTHGYIIMWMTVRNLGIAFSTMPASNAGMEVIPRELSGHASSVNNWIRQGFGSFSIGLFTSMLASRVAAHSMELGKAGGLNGQQLQQQAFTLSVNDVYMVATVVVLIGLPLALTLGKRRGKSQPEAAPGPGLSQKTS
ncbi:DHA2 family efflux MFS transporter permease subunit [Paenibacillus tyrfis]|uniref:DHA2 family efflux MFS transporter permease subunit n=1 Tax=Paenibacillus tyrfis TaxID=1501230 RepID=UPI0020A00C79|nr:DHA2 family efflux MFS transporter permease subunit [Paenibacillus tyrfis]MCP1312234.1 DHA2 family efflux MFS transporter permease subunit [Paenibacillus tyrfis]